MRKYKNHTQVACHMRLMHGKALPPYAHETLRRSNPLTRAPGERPIATLLSTSLRPQPPLSLYPNSGLTRIVAYGVAAIVDATPSGSTGIPFHSMQPFNDALDRSSVCPSICIPLDVLHYASSIPSTVDNYRTTSCLKINDINFSRICASSHFSPSDHPLQLPTSVCIYHFTHYGDVILPLCLSGHVTAYT